MQDIHLGDIGQKNSDKITFVKNNRKLIVSSGNGTPDIGGTLIKYPDQMTN